MRDIDGDGHPDIIVADGGKQLVVYRNLTGRTNLLRSVTLPFGGHIHIGYEQTAPSYDLPGRRWVMSSVETTGGYKENGAVRSRNTLNTAEATVTAVSVTSTASGRCVPIRWTLRTVTGSTVTPYRPTAGTGITMPTGWSRASISIRLTERNCRDLSMTTT